jgi:hypothetical protein
MGLSALLRQHRRAFLTGFSIALLASYVEPTAGSRRSAPKPSSALA